MSLKHGSLHVVLSHKYLAIILVVAIDDFHMLWGVLLEKGQILSCHPMHHNGPQKIILRPGSINKGPDISLFLSSLKVSFSLAIHWNLTFFLVESCKGPAIIENFSINLL